MLTLLLAPLITLSLQQQILADQRRHCQDLWQHHNIRTAGLHQIDPDDGDGELTPFTVYCDMGDGVDERKVVTIVHHDSEETGQVKGHEAPGSYIRNVTYKNATEAQVVALIDVSSNCEQYIKWSCKGAKFGFWYPPETTTWWVGRNWEPQFYWGGAQKDSRTCECHPYCNITQLNSTCNCDANTKFDWLTDEGLLLDRSRLPVLQLRVGDTGQPNEIGHYTLGPLKCRNILIKDTYVYLQNLTAPVKIGSPGFRFTYPKPFHRYLWDVIIPENVSAEIVFETYDVLFYGAYLSVPGCETVMRLQAFAQSSLVPIIVEKQKKSAPYFVSDGSRTLVRVSMTTCNQMDSVSEKGFEAAFRLTDCPGCGVGQGTPGGETMCFQECGIVASYNYPYPNHNYNPPPGLYNHTWIITGPRHHGIHLKFNDLDIPGIPGSRTCTPEREVLSVYARGRSGSDKLIGHFCNYNKEGNLYLRARFLRLVYVVRFEKVGNGRGFHAIYRATPKHNLPHSDGVIENVAKDKPALQSSTLENQGPHFAVDGITNGVLAAGSCISTNFEKEPWWRVDLQQRHIIHRVKIYNRELKTSSSATSLSWPKGRYGLPMSRIGCPATSMSHWESGMRYHDMECPVAMDGTIKHWTDGIQLKGGLQELQGIEQHFCMITVQAAGAALEWMPGQYCIFRYGGTCPDGFRTGFIRWTEKEGNNKNDKEGVLPDGIYDNYTLIHFCCRGDGEVDQPIRLPTGTPFYLLQYGIECQRVEGMNHRQHFFHFCEDRVADIHDEVYFTKPHPMVNTHSFEKGFALHYCYYDISTSLRGFRVLVDSVGFIETWTRFWDNKHYGIAHVANDKFSQAYICIQHPITEKELPLVDKNCTQPVAGQFVTLYVYDRYDSLQVCEVEIYGKKICGQPLGMAAEEIFDWQISATSADEPIHMNHPTNGRLNHRFAWCADLDDDNKSLMIDLGNVTAITGLVTQGLSQSSQPIYVKTFLVSFSNDNHTFWHEEEPVGMRKIYHCHQCQVKGFTNDLKITYNMLKPVYARFVRFEITEFKESPCARIEILGCRGKDHCDGDYTAPVGTITSPNHPYYYGQARSCWWKIIPPHDKHVRLNFYVVELARKEPQQFAGDCTDSLTVYPGSRMLPIRSTRDKKFPRYIVSNGTLRINLQSCFRVAITRRRGFYANYSFVDCPGCGIGDYACAELHLCTSVCGHIMSAGYPLSYENHHRCRWHIRVPFDHYINISVEDLDINGGPNCEDDFVDVYDGKVALKKATLLGRFCNSRPPTKNIVTNWNTVTIEFSSDAEHTGRGFHFRYTAEQYKLPEPLKKIRFNDTKLCPDPWKQYNNFCYGLFKEEKALQWYAAESKCNELGGHLVSIQDKHEMTVLHYLLTNDWKLSRWPTPGVYIGLTDENGEGRFRWTDGNPMSYADWAMEQSGEDDTHQPNGGQYEDCTKVHLSNIHSTRSWYDIPCSLDSTNGINAYICKKRSIAVDWNDTLPEWAFRDGFETSGDVVLPSASHFQCSSLEIVSQVTVCDGRADCADGSDELHCHHPCPSNSFTCTSGRCIFLYKYCDFKNDCGDESDEITCEHPECNEAEQFQCKNGQCIPLSKTCDLKKDCIDGSDETSCSGKCQQNNTFQCYDGTCIPRSTFCDGYYDCPGFHHEDETCSKKKLASPHRTTCRQSYKTCHELFANNPALQSGFYEIDPDITGPLMPFTVECRKSKDGKSVSTYVHHDTESRMYVRVSVEGPGSYQRDVVYDDASWQQLAALVNVSAECQQMVQWQCKGAGFHFDHHIPTSWWVSSDQIPQYSWGAGTRDGVCHCFPSCEHNLSCNCDADDTLHWREDAGYLKDKTKLPLRQVHFGNTHKTDRAGFHTIGPLECSGGVVDTNQNECSFLHQEIWCENGARMERKRECLYEFDSNGFMLGCRDASHLRNCEEFQCPPFYHKCPGSYCIPHRYRCNGLWDCPGGYDEMKCDGHVCIGQYHCLNQTYCIPLSQLCDGVQQCDLGDDETLCDVACPLTCECEGVYARCIGQNLTYIPRLTTDLRKLDFSHNRLERVELENNLIYLGELSLSQNSIVQVPPGSFVLLKNLYKLDLSFNNIQLIRKEAFLGLGNLKTLILDGNFAIKIIEADAFKGLQSLPELSIVHTQLSKLDSGVFAGLESLQLLNLSRNEIEVVADGAFSGLDRVKILDLHGNTIREFSKGIFSGLQLMEHLITDSFKFCCLAQPYVQFEHCLPQADEFSSCTDLMSNLVLRVFLWALGIVALVGNLVVIVWRSGIKDVKKASSALILSLGCADFLMGVYLIIVASVDTHYRGDYIAHSDSWRESALCKAAGFLSTLSSEVSVFTLTFITLERLVCIAFPLSTHRFTAECTRGLIISSWVAAAVLAGLPLFVRTYFHGQFYARSGVCLALHITNQKPAGWEYSVIVFFCINLIVFLVILAAYIYMYTSIRNASRKMSCALTRKASETKVGRQMTLIVLTNFCCWMPIILMGLCAMAGLSIPGEVYAWTAVFILPLNSATNPIIYTLCSEQFKTMILKKYFKRTPSTQLQNTCTTRSRNERYVRTYRPPLGYCSLVQFLRTSSPLLLSDVLEISKGICETLADLHETGLAFGGFEIDYIFVQKTETGNLNVYLPDINAYHACTPGGNVHSEESAKDMEDFGKIVKKMLQIYHVTCRQGDPTVHNCA